MNKDRKCEWCGKPISGSPRRRWCSDACKMKAYRDRKKEGKTKKANG